MTWWWLVASVWAGPGFSGVGGPSLVPGFDEEAVEGTSLAQVLKHEDELLALVARVDPSMHQRMLVLKESDRNAYLTALTRVAHNVKRARNDPEFRERMQRLRAKTRELREAARGYARLSSSEKKARRAELERLAGELMDLKQADRRARLEDMRGRIAELQEEIERRERRRERIIDEFVDQLLEERIEL